jgi:putative CocE/NonD family hydrolase
MSERPRNAVIEHEHVPVPMPDGTKLSARIWMPADAERNAVPAVLEYIPYRKRDFTAVRDSLMHPYFAARGYASIRLDARGAGDSEGVMVDEYTQTELEDGRDAIQWFAKQVWCTGKVGMLGGSWGGFNSLQVAALRPPALKAIITVVSTDDRYANDMHYMGGALLNDMMSWGQQFFTQLGRPPDPAIHPETWRDMWRQRLAAMEPVIGRWLRHQRRDAFWKHGSICQDYGAIECAVYAIGGWADGYSDAVFRMLKGLEAPCKGLVGPWGHGRPHFAVPGPQIGYLQEALRWWDHWLKGIDTGIMREPQLRVWMQESQPPATRRPVWPGRWVAEPSWPSPRIGETRLALDAEGLVERDSTGGTRTIRSPHWVGIGGGEWCPYGLGGVGDDLPLDQRLDDAGSLVFDGAPLATALEILGAPIVELELAADHPSGQVAVRLSDVAPDGQVARVTYGVLNLTHRRSHEHPEPLVPGQRERVRVQMCEIAHAFPAGHRLRLSISTCYWPIVWPAPDATTLTIALGSSALLLPVRTPQADDATLRPFEPPDMAKATPTTVLRAATIERRVATDYASGETVYEILRDDGAVRIEATGTVIETRKDLVYRVHEHDPLRTRSEGFVSYTMNRGDWRPEIRSRGVLTADRTHFRLRTELDVFDGETRFFSRSWDERIERDHV